MLRRRKNRGMTLVELLVVITILMLLAGFMVPRIPGMVQGQRLREASQAVHVAISTAQSRARELGRDCGIRIESRPGTSLLRVVETKAGFSGWTENATGVVNIGSGTLTLTVSDGVPSSVVEGSRLLIGGRRPELKIESVNTNATGSCTITAKRVNDDDVWPWTGTTFQASYLITPDPNEPQFAGSTRRPIILPAQTTVDLGWSGTDQGTWDEKVLRLTDVVAENGYVNSPTPDAVTILFGPEGMVTQVLCEYPRYAVGDYTNVISVRTIQSVPIQTVYLMVGRSDLLDTELMTPGIQVLSDAKNAMPIPIDRTNLSEGDCRWIAINAVNGRTITNLNIAQDGDTFNSYDEATRFADALWGSRLLAQDGGNATGN